MPNPAPQRRRSPARVPARGRAARRAAVLLVLAAGCRTPGPADGRAAEVPAEAYVVRVNAAREFVILDGLAAPRTGEELTVWRDGRRVALVRATDRRRPPFVAAEILAGAPRAGDLARGERPADGASTEMRP